MKLPAAMLSGFAALVLSGLLAACTVVVDDGPDYRPPRPERSHACTAHYVPVCARRGRDRQSFANSCMAERAGYRVVRQGLCRGEFENGGDAQAFCTREYAPVGASRRGETRTFPNACEARAPRWRVVANGPC
ncbi:MAG: peptidase [Mesorhizobium sp.]|nr:peptidase [Mesorhizobium sp.]